MSARFLIAMAALLCAVFSADAQVVHSPYGQKSNAGTTQQRQQQQLQNMVALDGTITAVALNRIQIVTTANQRLLVNVLTTTEVQVTGELNADALRPGLCVQFQADVGPHNTVSEKVSDLTVMTPAQNKPLGVFSQGGDAEKTGSKLRTAGPSTVRGQITKFNKNKLYIKFDKGTMICDLNDNPRVSLDCADYTLARKGDKINVRGVKSPTTASVQAAQVKIELAPPPAETAKTNR